MDQELARLIDDYLAAVREAVALMTQSEIPRPASRAAWSRPFIKQSGRLEGGVRYFKHGDGIEVALPSGIVDFDFGKRGEIDGFSACSLWYFAKCRPGCYAFASKQSVEAAFDSAARSSSIVPAEPERSASSDLWRKAG